MFELIFKPSSRQIVWGFNDVAAMARANDFPMHSLAHAPMPCAMHVCGQHRRARIFNGKHPVARRIPKDHRTSLITIKSNSHSHIKFERVGICLFCVYCVQSASFHSSAYVLHLDRISCRMPHNKNTNKTINISTTRVYTQHIRI